MGMLYGTALADADFYVPLEPEAIATLESKPHCSPQDAGELVRTRDDPSRKREDEEVHGQSIVLKLLLQPYSQPMAEGCRHGLLVAKWGRLLLPYQLHRTAAQERHRPWRCTTSLRLPHCVVVEGELTLLTVTTAGLDLLGNFLRASGLSTCQRGSLSCNDGFCRYLGTCTIAQRPCNRQVPGRSNHSHLHRDSGCACFRRTFREDLDIMSYIVMLVGVSSPSDARSL